MRFIILITGLLLCMVGTLYAAGPRMTMSPAEAQAGKNGVFTFTFTAGDGGVQTGGGFEMVFFCRNDKISRNLLWSCLQEIDPTALGAVEVESSSGSVKLELLDGGGGDTPVQGGRFLRATMHTGNLPAGGTITLRYLSRTIAIARPFRFQVRARQTAADTWTTLPEADRPIVNITPRQARLVLAFVPADVVIGEPFTGHIVALDKYGNPATGYRGKVTFTSSDASLHGSVSYKFTAGDAGKKTFPGLRFKSEGIQNIAFSDDDENTAEGPDAWLQVHRTAPPFRRYFGDTHFHTGAGTGYDGWAGAGGDHKGNYARLDEAYAYMRDVWHMDFAAGAEHDSGLDAAAKSVTSATTNAFNQPGKFTTFHAWEWTRRHTHEEGGHRVILYPGNRLEGIFSSDDSNYQKQSDLFRALHDQGTPAVVVPHMMRLFEDHQMWVVRDNSLQTVAEVYSAQNETNAVGGDKTAFEENLGDPWAVREAWKRGHIIGLVGASDNHTATPAHHRFGILTSHQEGGYAVLLAPNNTRGDLFGAFQARRSYATTGNRALAWLEVDGSPMGAMIQRDTGKPTIRGHVAGSARIKQLSLFRGDFQRGFVDLRPADLDSRPEVFEFSVTDNVWDQNSLYYVRAEQDDGEFIWTSPVWLLKRNTLKAGPSEIQLEDAEREFNFEKLSRQLRNR